MTRYALDASTRRFGSTVVCGSPLTLFRLSSAGVHAFARLADGDDEGRSILTDRLLEAGAIHPLPDRSDARLDDVTVVVPAHRTVSSQLAAIVVGCRGVRRVIVVDDGSQPPIGALAGADVVRIERNAGPAAARNAGLAEAATPFVAFVDVDVTVHAGWLEPLLAHFGDERVGLVAPRIVSRPTNDAIGRYERRRSPLDLGDAPARVAAGTRVSYVPAAALVVRTDAIRELGGFDVTMRFGEDVDAVWRMVDRGWQCRYEPAVRVEHEPRRSWGALIWQRIGYGSSAAALARRHPGAVAPVRISGWTAAVWALVALGRWRAALLLGGGTALALVRKLPDVPASASLRLAGLGHIHAGGLLADAVRRVWWPVLLPLGAVSRRARFVAAAAIVPALVDGGPSRLVDDVAYGVGVWRGVIAQRSPAALLPVLTPWPAGGRTRRYGRQT